MASNLKRATQATGQPHKASYAESTFSLRDSLRSASPSSLPPSPGFSQADSPDGLDDQYGLGSSGDQSFVPSVDIEVLAERLFSIDHLKVILQNPAYFPRFQNFLTRYRPEVAQTLKRYLDVQKALVATKYANALAESLWPGLVAAVPDIEFERKLDTAFTTLTKEALPGYITHRMSALVTEILVKEITGQNTPVMKGLVNGLAEVYCLTDPRIHDNPIIYASDQFYVATGYDSKAVIGKNCRFLQGSKTSSSMVGRLIEALGEGQEICEAILNYRKNGEPFINLLLIAPLHDSNGKVRYFIGAQIDINGLIEDGRGLESFATLLANDKKDLAAGKSTHQTPLSAITELGTYLNEHDRAAINRTTSNGKAGTPYIPSSRRKQYGMNDATDNELWPAPDFGPNGRLPGVFQNVCPIFPLHPRLVPHPYLPSYLTHLQHMAHTDTFPQYILVRPYPSLRILYTAPGMLASTLIDTRFLSWIRGPSHVRLNIKNALSYGQSFTAKVSWLTGRSAAEVVAREADLRAAAAAAEKARKANGGVVVGGVEGDEDDRLEEHRLRGGGGQTNGGGSAARYPDDIQSRPLWIHCTPLLGEEGRVGLWMIVMVKGEGVQQAMAPGIGG